jgi:hypothetical protein
MCWLEFQKLVAPQGNLKGANSFNISNTRREVGSGISAAAAPLSSIASFNSSFPHDDNQWRRRTYEAFLGRTEKINMLLSYITVALLEGVLPPDVLQALRLRRSSFFFPPLPPKTLAHNPFPHLLSYLPYRSFARLDSRRSRQLLQFVLFLSVLFLFRRALMLCPLSSAHHRQLNVTSCPAHPAAAASSSSSSSSSSQSSSSVCFFPFLFLISSR